MSNAIDHEWHALQLHRCFILSQIAASCIAQSMVFNMAKKSDSTSSIAFSMGSVPDPSFPCANVKERSGVAMRDYYWTCCYA